MMPTPDVESDSMKKKPPKNVHLTPLDHEPRTSSVPPSGGNYFTTKAAAVPKLKVNATARGPNMQLEKIDHSRHTIEHTNPDNRLPSPTSGVGRVKLEPLFTK